MPHPVFAALPCARISYVVPVFSTGGATFFRHGRLLCRRSISAEASDGIGAPAAGGRIVDGDSGARADGERNQTSSEAQSRGPLLSASSIPVVKKDIKKVVQKTAATFAPRASTASKNPAVPGTALYTIFEVQGYASMLIGGALSFNLIFPSNEPDIWRLMGMWSIWMFTIPSLRARDCSKNEKEALNYLFLLIPLLNVLIPFFWKSFAVVWSADTIAFFVLYAWKMGWLQRTE
ncbi:protein RESISTANCE TO PHYTOPHTHORA 1, chloroplastic [Dendrobium catenatum]|uniref:Protein RESISTANCE TO PHYTOPHTHORA 1, chloroplastic n=1 Tax=Dendrobium catenatum TaxID=906689 RepID=A0A2I0WIA9_9ASPA|nr:protein RESISTANCE TO PHYTOPHTHORA 1, chloroplastic [Dendrobium catenatum]PKU75368.1 hypothetical protein MA16_Dca027404 [Dendrobium catenatum]